MQFGSNNWDENDTTDALNNALFGNNKKNIVKSTSTKKKKSAKQIDQETKQAKEFLQNFKSVQKTQKIVQFDVSDGESDDDNDLSKRAKKNLKERNRKKRKKELKRKENVKKRKENLDSDEELFAEIDEENDLERKETKKISEKVPEVKKIRNVQATEKPKKLKKKNKNDKAKKLALEAENPQTGMELKENGKVDNPFQCETKNLTKKQKKKLKKKENQEKLAMDLKKTEKTEVKTKNLQNNIENHKDVKVKPLNKVKNEGSEVKPTKKKKSKVKVEAPSESSKVTNSVRSDTKVNNATKVTQPENGKGESEGKPQKKKKSKAKQEQNSGSITGSDRSNIVTKNVQNGMPTKTDQNSKKKRKNSENEGHMTPEKKPKMNSDFQEKFGKDKASVQNGKSSKTIEGTNKQVNKFNAKKLSDILSNKNGTGIVLVPKTERNSKMDKKDLKHKKGTTSLQERMKNQLNQARFRFLNEQLYTQTGPEAFSMFQEDEESFKVYHEGFQSQVSKWPVNPLNIFIKQVKKLPKTDIIADFGCGTAELAQSVPQKVHSFDFVPLNNFVTVCDISKVPLSTKSIDVTVFCLSLMGTNLNDYISEANRVLKPGGELKIAEVESRIADTQTFISQIESFGFKLLEKETNHKMFHLFYFNKVKPCIKSGTQDIQLDPCIYKRR